ncbi:MAG: DUF3426 domain-containing protein [Proteobacteria bacterium]|nr:DUF3426 domain-containing protein [Pseudomonadota bacterium]
MDAALLGDAGRNVRCAKCGHKWKQLPPKLENPEGTPAEIALTAEPTVPETAPSVPEVPPLADPASTAGEAEAPAVEIPSAPPRPRSPQRPTGPITVPPKLRPMMPKRRFRLHPIYIVLAGMVLGLGVVFYFRAEIARAVPALDMVYSLMGISTSSPADDLKAANLVVNKRNEAGGKAVWAVEADLFNESEFPVQLPPLAAITYDGNGKEIGDWKIFRLEQESIEPGETIRFRIFFDSLPKGTKTMWIKVIAQ